MTDDDRKTLDFVTLWMSRYVDGEATAEEVIGVLRWWPDAPWANGRPKPRAIIPDPGPISADPPGYRGDREHE